jgi:hypothetical protein
MDLLQVIGHNYLMPVILFLAAQTVLFITACITIYVRVMTRLRELEIRVNIIENNEEELFKKIEEVLAAIHRVELNMVNKQDRNGANNFKN